MSWLSYFIVQKIAEFQSPFNGTVSVIESFGRYYIDVAGLMQSGPFLVKTWTKGLEKLKIPKKKISRVLILGLGGGSFVQVINKFFPRAHIDAVDIDRVIVSVGEKYLGLKESERLHIYIEDAQKHVSQIVKNRIEYDLVFVDMYTGYTIPKFAQSDIFLQQLRQIANKNGGVIFNRLNFQNHKNEAAAFLDKLNKIFQDVVTAKVYANILILSKN